MIDIAKIFLYSLIVGFIAAGFVYYGWGLMQNINALRAAAFARKALAQTGDETPEDAPADA